MTATVSSATEHPGFGCWQALSRSARQTKRLAHNLAALFAPGDVIELLGPLGAGKTTFVQGLAGALGLPPGVWVNSPTFTILNEVPTNPPLYHFDFYRLNDPDELLEIGFYELLGQGGITLIEWLALIPEACALANWRVELRDLTPPDPLARRLLLSPLTADSAARLAVRRPKGFAKHTTTCGETP